MQERIDGSNERDGRCEFFGGCSAGWRARRESVARRALRHPVADRRAAVRSGLGSGPNASRRFPASVSHSKLTVDRFEVLSTRRNDSG